MNNVESHIQSLGQKYMGSARPSTAADYMFKSNVAKTDGVHPVPVSNFMNAQCELHDCSKDDHN